MERLKADYSQIADNYDQVRRMTDVNLEMWLGLVHDRLQGTEEVRILDLGCGTGRFSTPFATSLGYSVVGVDGSFEMIEKAYEKAKISEITGIFFVQADASEISFADSDFDVVWMSHLLHHTDNPYEVIKEAYRVLLPGGVIFNRYGAWEDIDRKPKRSDPEHEFFSRVSDIDRARTPTTEQVENWFTKAGLSQIETIKINQRTYRTSWERWKKARGKSTSVLTMITKEDFEKGLEKFKKYVKDNPNDPWLFRDIISLSWGRKGN